MSRRARCPACRQGLSLMEVIISIAILGGAMAVISNLVYLGAKSAGKSKWLSEAQILCDTKMAEISAGVLPLESIGGATIIERPDWNYSVAVQSSDLDGLLSVVVTVQPAPGVTMKQMPVTLTRLLPDPDFQPEQSVIQ